MELDHVVIAVPDLDTAARTLEERHGLTSVEGGRHAGWGTANRIVPLGDTYVELIAVVDEREAPGSTFGRWVGEATRDGARPLGWAVRTDELDDLARRLGLEVTDGSRPTGDGELLRWRVAGVAEAAAEPSLPFFLEWAAGSPFPGRAPAASAAGVRIAELRVSGNAERLGEWLGADALPVAVDAGAPALTRVVLEGGGGEIVLDADALAP